MTHVNNVQAFEKLLGICTGLGGSYNPGKQNLRIENVSNLLILARGTLLQVSIAKSNHEQAQNDREISFKEMRSLIARIMAELRSSGALPQTVADATLMVRRIRGFVKADKPTATTATEATDGSNEASGRKRNSADFGNSTAYFEKLLQTLGNESMYRPMHPALQMDTLQAKLIQLRSANAAVVAAYVRWSNARRERTNVLYVGPDSLHNTAMAMKQQVQASFGFSNEATALVRKIRFTKLIK